VATSTQRQADGGKRSRQVAGFPKFGQVANDRFVQPQFDEVEDQPRESETQAQQAVLLDPQRAPHQQRIDEDQYRPRDV
jgi:hypothetical protein